MTLAAEGICDLAVARRLCRLGGHTAAAVAGGLGGKARLDGQLAGYNRAARRGPWLVLRDLDNDAECAPSLVRALLPDAEPAMLLRVPVRSVEAWLLADREGFARYFSVPAPRIPERPDGLTNPKRAVVDLARRSRSRAIRDEMAPAPGRSAEIGPGYTARFIEFVSQHWDPEMAAMRSPSLAGCLRALKHLPSK